MAVDLEHVRQKKADIAGELESTKLARQQYRETHRTRLRGRTTIEGGDAPPPDPQLEKYTAEIQRMKGELEDITTLERLLQVAEATGRSSVDSLDVRRDADDQAFWLRRFHTFIVVANGAGLFSVIAGVLAANDAGAARLAQPVLWPFAIGLLAAGAIPILAPRRSRLASRKMAPLRKLQVGLAALGAAALLVGVWSAIGAVSTLARERPPVLAAVITPAPPPIAVTASPAPTSPPRPPPGSSPPARRRPSTPPPEPPVVTAEASAPAPAESAAPPPEAAPPALPQ